MIDANQTNQDEEIKKILEQNLKLTEEIYLMTKKMKSYLAFQRLVSFFYLFLIIAPIILSIIYLPPLLKGFFSQYKEALGIQSGSGGAIQELLNGAAGSFNLNNSEAGQIKNLLNE